jgi:membrane-associated phospholipid phosphatase
MSSRVRLRIAVAFASAFVMLTAVVWFHPLIGEDATIDRGVIAQPGSVGWNIAVVASFFASGPVVALAGVLAAIWTAWRLRRPASGVALVAAPAVAGMIELALKSVIGRARPVTAILSGESGNGYPSGHVTGFSALVVALLVVWMLEPGEATRAERWAAAALVGASIVLVAWSRIALGAHYMTDTIGGALLGVSVGLVCPWLCALGWERWWSASRAAI